MPCGARRLPVWKPVDGDSALPLEVNSEAALPPMKLELKGEVVSLPVKFESHTRSRESTAIPHQLPWMPPPVTGLPFRGRPVGSSETTPRPASVSGGDPLKLFVIQMLPCESNAIRPGPLKPPAVRFSDSTHP